MLARLFGVADSMLTYLTCDVFMFLSFSPSPVSPLSLFTKSTVTKTSGMPCEPRQIFCAQTVAPNRFILCLYRISHVIDAKTAHNCFSHNRQRVSLYHSVLSLIYFVQFLIFYRILLILCVCLSLLNFVYSFLEVLFHFLLRTAGISQRILLY